jgi:hypothetical protein
MVFRYQKSMFFVNKFFVLERLWVISSGTVEGWMAVCVVPECRTVDTWEVSILLDEKKSQINNRNI